NGDRAPDRARRVQGVRAALDAPGALPARRADRTAAPAPLCPRRRDPEPPALLRRLDADALSSRGGAADLPRTVEGAREGGAAVTTRAEFMARIRAEMGKTRGLFPASPATRPEYPREEAEAIRAQLAERWPEALERFRREFEKVGGVFHRVPTLTEVPQVVTGIARAREARRLVSWHPSQLGADLGQAHGATEDRGAVISFITGPSRTADIELTLTRGVHGPKEVHVIFVEREIRG